MLNVKGMNDLLRNCSGKELYACIWACYVSASSYRLWCLYPCGVSDGMSQGCPFMAYVAASFGNTALLAAPHSFIIYSFTHRVNAFLFFLFH